MAEKMGEVYEAYDMEVQGIGRGRGAIILMTDKGIRQVSSLMGRMRDFCRRNSSRIVYMKRDSVT